jgi:hypothetical protein
MLMVLEDQEEQDQLIVFQEVQYLTQVVEEEVHIHLLDQLQLQVEDRVEEEVVDLDLKVLQLLQRQLTLVAEEVEDQKEVLQENGGSGIVIVRGPSSANFSAAPGTNTVTTLPAPAGGCKVATFTVSGTLTVS